MSVTYQVGQRVWCYDINSRGRGPTPGTVSKVGRTLVTVDDGFRPQQYRIESGQQNGPYGSHYWIKTEEQRVADDERADLLAALRAHGVEFRCTHPSAATLRSLVAVMDGAQP